MYEGKLKELYNRYLEAHRLASQPITNSWQKAFRSHYMDRLQQAEAAFRQEEKMQANLQNNYEIGHVSQLNNALMQSFPQVNAQGPIGSDYPSPVMMEHLFALMNANQPKYIPVKKGPSISDRIMNSFDPALFSPEFIPPEEQ